MIRSRLSICALVVFGSLVVADSARGQIQGWNTNQFGRGGIGLGGVGRRGFMPRNTQPFTNYAKFYSRMSGRAPRIAGPAGGMATVPILPKDTSLDPLLEELGIDDKQSTRRRGDIDPTLRKWPTWLQVGGPGERVDLSRASTEDRPQASECYFVRMSDRVDIQPSGEKGFFPLEFWDTARRLGIGSRIRTSGRGRAILLFSDGTQVDLVGASECVFSQGTVDRLVLQFDEIDRAFVTLGKRGVEFRLPEGSVLRGTLGNFTVDTVTDDKPMQPDDPRPADRIIVTNWGPKEMRIEAPPSLRGLGADSIELPIYRRTVLVLPAARDLARDPSLVDLPKTIPGGGIDIRAGVHATIRKDRDGLEVEARSGDAPVHWGGARLRVPVGTSVRIDPLLGDPFQEGAGR
ncbi:MAG: hypothetical protein KDC95_19815 [Planctomycetes bacterium]|nr:hypothetical protein [Planctomycetota bacterium]